MRAPSLRDTFVLHHLIQLGCNEFSFSFCFCGTGCYCWGPMGAGRVSEAEALATQIQSQGSGPSTLGGAGGGGGRGLVQATQSSSCSHRNRRWAEWVAWLCSPFLFLFKSLLAMHCLLVIFVLTKIKTVAKKTLPTSKQLALQADDIYSGGVGLEIWLDLAGSEIGYLFFKPCTDRPPRAVPGWDWQTNLNTNAAPGGTSRSRAGRAHKIQ